MGLFNNNAVDNRLGSSFASSGARAAISLNSAYTHLTSGAGIAVRIEAPETGNINEAFVFLDAFTGTLGNITMRCRIYNESTTATQPGSTLRATASTVTMPGAADQWIRAQFSTPYSATRGEILWFVWDNTAGAPATDFPQILSSTNTSQQGGARFIGYSTTNGFSTAGTAQTEIGHMFQIGSNWFGNPITASTTLFTNNTLKRGIIVTPTVDIDVRSFDALTSASTLTTIDVYESTQLPNDTPIHSYSLSSVERLLTSHVLATPITLYKGKTYYIVADYSANSTQPGGGQIEDYSSFSSNFDALFDGMYFVQGLQEQAGNTWSIIGGFVPNLRIGLDATPAKTVTFAA